MSSEKEIIMPYKRNNFELLDKHLEKLLYELIKKNFRNLKQDSEKCLGRITKYHDYIKILEDECNEEVIVNELVTFKSIYGYSNYSGRLFKDTAKIISTKLSVPEEVVEYYCSYL